MNKIAILLTNSFFCIFEKPFYLLKHLFIIILFLSGCVLSIIILLSFSYINAKIEVSPSDLIVLSPVDEGEIVKIHYMIENKSQWPIELLSVKPSCRCTTVKMNRNVSQSEPYLIKPGDRIPLEATIETEQRLGSFDTEIMFLYRNVNKDKIKLETVKTKIEVRPSLRVSPTSFTFDSCKPGEVIQGEICIMDGMQERRSEYYCFETSSALIKIDEYPVDDNTKKNVSGSHLYIKKKLNFTISTENQKRIIDEKIFVYSPNNSKAKAVIPIICYME